MHTFPQRGTNIRQCNTRRKEKEIATNADAIFDVAKAFVSQLSLGKRQPGQVASSSHTAIHPFTLAFTPTVSFKSTLQIYAFGLWEEARVPQRQPMHTLAKQANSILLLYCKNVIND